MKCNPSDGTGYKVNVILSIMEKRRTHIICQYIYVNLYL